MEKSKIEEILNSLSGIKPAPGSPQLYARVMAKKTRIESFDQPVLFVKPLLVTISLALMLAINIYFLSGKEKDVAPLVPESFGTEYIISPETIYP